MNLRFLPIIFLLSLSSCNLFSKPHEYIHPTDKQMNEKLNDNEAEFNKLVQMFKSDWESKTLKQGWLSFNDFTFNDLSEERKAEYSELINKLSIKQIRLINEGGIKGYFLIEDIKSKKVDDGTEIDRKGYFYATEPPYFLSKFGSEDYSDDYYKKLNKNNWYIRHDTFIFGLYDIS